MAARSGFCPIRYGIVIAFAVIVVEFHIGDCHICAFCGRTVGILRVISHLYRVVVIEIFNADGGGFAFRRRTAERVCGNIKRRCFSEIIVCRKRGNSARHRYRNGAFVNFKRRVFAHNIIVIRRTARKHNRRFGIAIRFIYFCRRVRIAGELRSFKAGKALACFGHSVCNRRRIAVHEISVIKMIGKARRRHSVGMTVAVVIAVVPFLVVRDYMQVLLTDFKSCRCCRRHVRPIRHVKNKLLAVVTLIAAIAGNAHNVAVADLVSGVFIADTNALLLSFGKGHGFGISAVVCNFNISGI